MLTSILSTINLALFVNNSITQRLLINVQDHNLISVPKFVGNFPDLDLSNLNLTSVSDNAFVNSCNLHTLNLANNRLKTLPALHNLSSLESLNLAENEISSGKFYAGLSSLKTLNISNNPLTFFEPGHFFGLTSPVNILTQGLKISFITAAMFENPVTLISRHLFEKKLEERGMIISSTFLMDNDTELLSLENNSYREIEVCIEHGHLTSVKILDKATFLSRGCRTINLSSGTLFLANMGIRTFENGWYRLQDQNVTSIDLSNNEITQFTKELLNDLPAGILKVHLVRNRIQRLEQGIIENRHNIRVLDLGDNFISKIDEGALEKLNLTEWLLLDNNHLEDTKFLDSLPPHIQKVSLDRNFITQISASDCTKSIKLKGLSLADNSIKIIRAQTLCGFSALTELSLRKNRVTYIECGAFNNLENLLSLDLTANKLSNFDKDAFSHLRNIRQINLDSNKIDDILGDLLRKMPESLELLTLSKNRIKTWIARRFKFSKVHTDSWRRINAFNVPNLKVLDVRDNFLENVEGDFFKGLKNLTYLSLAGNNITTIRKSLTKHMGNLQVLDLSRNPIEKLKNGALFGLSKEPQTTIWIDRVPLKLIQGGLFDDV